MNKKFSTLAVAAMLASAFTAYAGPGHVVTKLAEGNNGKQYQLTTYHNGEVQYLTLEGHDKALKLTSADELDKIGTSLWCVDVTRENEGKNPIFDFTNKAGKSVLDVTVGGWNVDWDKTTYTGLWVDKDEAHVGGEVRGWEFTPVLGSDAATGGVYMFGRYAKPGTDANTFAASSTKKVYSLNSYISTTHVATLVWDEEAQNADGTKGQIKVAVVKADDLNNSALAEIQIKFFLQEAYPVNLTAEQFNTILDTQDADEKVKMTFDKDYNNTEVVNPFSTNEFNAEAIDNWNKETNPFVYLYKKDAAEKRSYLRVDTAYVNGFGTKFLGFAFKEAKKETNRLDEANAQLADQYLFRLNYCPTDDSLSIQVKKALYKVNNNNKWWKEGLTTSADAKEFYTVSWTDYVKIDGTKDSPKATGGNRNWVKLQDLEASTESRIVTVGDAPINTHISFGYGTCAEVASAYTSVADGVYYIKNSKGQYLAHPIYNNGNKEPLFVTVSEQEVAHMPAYQWVVLKKYTNTAASKATSPVMIANREFDTDFEYDGVQLMKNEGAKYMSVNSSMTSTTKWGEDIDGNGAVDWFPEILSTKDSIEFVAVPETSVKDQYLGYKKIEKDSLLVNKYTFNYWHPYATDKFIAKSDKDSTLTVLEGRDAFGIRYLIPEDYDATEDQGKWYQTKSSVDMKYGFAKAGAVTINGKSVKFEDVQKRISGLAQLARTAYIVDADKVDWKVNDNEQFNLGANYDPKKAPWVFDVQNFSQYWVFFKDTSVRRKNLR